ncbi:hypothetical protein BKA25_000506 [Actinoalloteichus hymeniacidonis]|uniref:Uncharacterized protein n=1 Tax=Actinoalloteichus hymeniacidonis TaxID=340345 RepID=A0AAC9HWF6_9PSEU|nr:hypothetical protein TL08_24710 [Actinoalloteichus hymeniacidonis]MBB5906190.1 hypothetical protein [Actinoalloteichus hymeniacidonis]
MALVNPGAPLFWEAIAPENGLIWNRHGAPGIRPDPGTRVTAFCGAEFRIPTPNARAVIRLQRTCLRCADHAWKLRTGLDWPPSDLHR